MPTVCASVPMHAPRTTSFRCRPARIALVHLGRRQQRVGPLLDVDRVEVDQVPHAAVDDEERVAAVDGVAVHDHRGLDAHLGRQLQCGALRPGTGRHGQRERRLHHAVAGRVAVRPDDRPAPAIMAISAAGRLRHLRAPGPAGRARGCRRPRRGGRRRRAPCRLSGGRLVMPKVPSAMACISPPAWSTIRSSSSTASRSTVSARRSMNPPFGGAKSSARSPGGVQHVADVAQGQVPVGQPRRDDGLGHHPDQQDALAGERPGEVEEAVEQVAAEDVAGHVLGRRHPLQRRVREERPGQQRVGQLEPERLLPVRVDLERVPEAELPVLEAGLLGKRLVEQLADGDGVRLVDGVRGGEVVVLAGVDDDPGAGVHHPAEPLVDEGALRVDVAEEDPVHRVVEHHVQPLQAGQDGDLGHAQARRVVGQPDVAAELGADVVQGGPHQPEVLLGGVGARVPGAGGALGHVVQQRLPGRADDGDDVGAGPRGGLGLRDVLVDVAGRHDQVDPGTARRVAVEGDQLVAAPPVGVDAGDAPSDGRAGGLARVVGGRNPSGSSKRAVPAPTCSARACRDGAAPVASACQTGSATPRSRPTWSRTASTTRLTQGTGAVGRRRRPSPGRCRSGRPAAAPPARRRRSCAGGPGRRPAGPRARPAPGHGRPASGRAPTVASSLPHPGLYGHKCRWAARERPGGTGTYGHKGRRGRHGMSPIGSPATSRSRQSGRARAARTAESVSGVAHSARSRGCADGQRAGGGARRGRRASRRGWRRRRRRRAAAPSRACGGRPRRARRPTGPAGSPGRRCRARGRRPRRPGRRTGWWPAPARRRAARRTCPPSPPQAASKAGCTLATMAQSRHPRDGLVVGHLHVLEPVPAGPDGGAAQLVDDRADRVEHLAHGGVADDVEAGLDAGGRAGPHVVDQLADVEAQRARGLGPVDVGACSARRCASRRRRRRRGRPRRRPAPARGPRRGRRARTARPSSRRTRGPGLLARRAPAGPAGRRRRRPPGRPSRARLPMPSAAAAAERRPLGGAPLGGVHRP